ncbi:unnamed protein product [Chrysoparadoxa australica]
MWRSKTHADIKRNTGGSLSQERLEEGPRRAPASLSKEELLVQCQQLQAALARQAEVENDRKLQRDTTADLTKRYNELRIAYTSMDRRLQKLLQGKGKGKGKTHKGTALPLHTLLVTP